MNFEIKDFDELGYLGPFKFINSVECEQLLKERFISEKLYQWRKSIHEKSQKVIDYSSKNLILDKIKSLIGNDVLLWGSEFIVRKPHEDHKWHMDREFILIDGITVWLGLKNLNNKTSISLITHSHKLKTQPYFFNFNDNKNKNDYDKLILDEAKKLNPECKLKTFYLEPGELIIWKDRIWHSTKNESQDTRYSIIYQYCKPKYKVKMPIENSYGNVKFSNKDVPCILLNGEDKYKLNKIISKKVEPKNKLLRKLRRFILY